MSPVEPPKRFKTREIQIGKLKIGGIQPIAVQSMTTTDTKNVSATVEQVKALVAVGCEIVRITAPTIKDAEALKQIRDQLRAEGGDVPLVADIHFQPAAAMIAADYVDKVRINPGNFADRKMFKQREYTDEEYKAELVRIEEKFKPLVLKLKSMGKAMRIGTNHGSLSDRVMNRYGDTPEGMIQSAFEYAEVCRKYDFHNFCFSMKASNVSVMIGAYRLLVRRQQERGWDYPIHLGVTEAGDGEDARIKSSIGIGTLLAEGIGDTIRVSLTESPVYEVPVAKVLAEKFSKDKPCFSQKYPQDLCEHKESKPPQVWLKWSSKEDWFKNLQSDSLRPDVLFLEGLSKISDASQFKSEWSRRLGLPQLELAAFEGSKLSAEPAISYWVKTAEKNDSAKMKFVSSLRELKEREGLDSSKVILKWEASQSKSELENIIDASLNLGAAFIDFPTRAVMVAGLDPRDELRLAYGILQATRRRMSKTEYIACPSCGRTLFNLEETTARIKQVTSHLKGVKIAVMGCIVNGPGEMADADFGYVGGAPGRVNLYVEKECVERNIPSAEAPDRLVNLIKKNGKWVEPEEIPTYLTQSRP